MATAVNRPTKESPAERSHPFRSAVLRGMGALAPPLLTVLIFLWIINTTRVYFLEPVTYYVREALVLMLADVRDDATVKQGQAEGEVYQQLDNGTYVPKHVYRRVKDSLDGQPMPQTGRDIYRQYIDLTWLRPWISVPFFLAVFVLLLYLLGKFMAAGLGAVFVNLFDQGMRRLPFVRSVYTSVKQVSDLFFTRPEIEFSRIVAVEFPRKGTWTIGFVTGEGILQVHKATGEPLVTVLVPYSPIPHTGQVIVVKKSECIDLNMTIDQAFQFIFSCGVVVPPHEHVGSPALPRAEKDEGGRR